MKNHGRTLIYGGRTLSCLALFASALFINHTVSAGPVHAFYADEHNTAANTPIGNRILEIDIDNMTLVNSLDVPGLSGHHADNGYNSKIYGAPKDSGYVNVIELRKDQNGTTSMQVSKQINLIHMPRSGDAYNKKFNVILMAARNRPMGTFINIETDEIVGTIGENIDCTLTDGTRLLSHADANTIASATKYQCATLDHGGDQVSGHPYWLTPDYAAIIDRTNRQISVYEVWQEGNQLKSTLVNHLKTRTSVHQIVPRDRTNLPVNQQADFYAVEEGKHANQTDFSDGIAHALIKMKLTNNGLQFISRINLQRTEVLQKEKAQRILNECVANYRNTNNYRHGRSREQAYNDLFAREGIGRNPDQLTGNDFPVDCFYPGIPGGHNADFAPNNKHLYVPMAGGALSIIDVNRWKIVNNLDIGVGSGPGHICFSAKHNIAVTVNHAASFLRIVRNINSERPNIGSTASLPFTKEGITNTYNSHTCYIDENKDYYYNFFTDGGVFFRYQLIDLVNNRPGNLAQVDASIYTGGIPIQGSYINLDDIKPSTPNNPFAVNHDAAESDGSSIVIDVLQNDTGPNLVLEAVDPASSGTVSISNGKLSYTPNAGFSGTDGFWYGVSSNGDWHWKWVLVTITVNSTTPPNTLNANKDEVSAVSGISTRIDVLANDTGDDLTIGWFDAPINGEMNISNNQFVFIANSHFSGTENLWYEVRDSSGQTTWGNLIITVTPNHSEVIDAKNDTATVQKGHSVLIDVLANDIGNCLDIDIVDDVWTGSVSITNGKVEYHSDGNYTGLLEVWYAAADANGDTDWAKISINITP